jgi:hypothetical protein
MACRAEQRTSLFGSRWLSVGEFESSKSFLFKGEALSEIPWELLQGWRAASIRDLPTIALSGPLECCDVADPAGHSRNQAGRGDYGQVLSPV